MPWPIVRMLYAVRCQVATLMHTSESIQRDVRRLFAAQQDMEQALIKQ
jgi:hypothetical protein